MIKRRLRDARGSARREGSLTDGSRVFAATTAAATDSEAGRTKAVVQERLIHAHTGNRIYLSWIYDGTGVHGEDVFAATTF